MRLGGAGSVTRALARSLLAGLTILWLVGAIGSGFVLKRIIDERSDEELEESAYILLSVVTYTDDLLVTAAVLGGTSAQAVAATGEPRYVYQVRDPTGRVLLRSHHTPPEMAAIPLHDGFVEVDGWRIFTVTDAGRKHVVQLADPLAERRGALLDAMLWLTIPLAVLLAFAAWIVFRASRTLVSQVERTAHAVARQDPQALGLLPLDGVVTEMRPAVDATNRLISRLADALSAERSFTYNSAHELRTPIAAALAQAQNLAAMAEGSEMKPRADALVDALARLALLAERLLALARAESSEPLAESWVDLATVVRLTVDELNRLPRLDGRRIVGEAAPVRVRGDLDAVGLAVRNLVENALVHGAGGTTIRIASRSTPDGGVLSVIDDGPGTGGVDPATLVQRFARGEGARGRGAGLGLSIVDTLARRMGARLVLRSPPDGQARGFEARLVWGGA